MWELGTVIRFDPRSNKRFGFLQMSDGETLFFHFNDGELIGPGEKEPKFLGRGYRQIRETRIFGRSVLIPDGNSLHLRDPQPGDTLFFKRRKSRDGRMKASPWGFSEQYQAASRILINKGLATANQR